MRTKDVVYEPFETFEFMKELHTKEVLTEEDFTLASFNTMFTLQDGSAITREAFAGNFEIVPRVKLNWSLSIQHI